MRKAEQRVAADLLACLQEAIEDSEEVLAVRISNLGENYRPQRLAAMREQITKGRAAIAEALALLAPLVHKEIE